MKFSKLLFVVPLFALVLAGAGCSTQGTGEVSDDLSVQRTSPSLSVSSDDEEGEDGTTAESDSETEAGDSEDVSGSGSASADINAALKDLDGLMGEADANAYGSLELE